MFLILFFFLGVWLLFWAIVIGSALLKRLEGARHPMTLLDDSHVEL